MNEDMKMPPIDPYSQMLGEIKQNQINMGDTLKNIEKKVDDLKDFQSATEQRLKSGNKAFERHEDRLNDNEEKIQEIELKMPCKNTIYSFLFLGFAILSLLMTYFGMKKNDTKVETTKIEEIRK